MTSLIPDWRERCAPLTTQVTEDRFLVLGPQGDVRLPNIMMPPLMNNHGNYIGSLGLSCAGLASRLLSWVWKCIRASRAAEVLYDDDGAVVGVATGDMGVARDGTPKDTFQRGMELRGKYTLIAEGARGSLAKTLISRFDLARDSEPQKYGIGLKELWEVSPELHKPGSCSTASAGRWTSTRAAVPSSTTTGRTSFRSVSSSTSNYDNPYLSPYDEFQRFKTHPAIRGRVRGRAAHRLRRAGADGRRLAVDPEADFPGRRAARLQRGLHEPPAHQGQP